MASAVTPRMTLAFLGGEARDEVSHQFGDVVAAVAQRRHEDREDVEAIEQILAEQAVLDLLEEVAVGGRDQPDVDPDRRAGADRIDLAVLHRAQQLDLHVERQFADFVEEQRAAMRLDELAGVLFGGAGEGALLVAEQDALDEVVRDGAAIDGDERLRAPVAGALDGARDQFLADARFALDQDRDVARPRRSGRAG